MNDCCLELRQKLMQAEAQNKRMREELREIAELALGITETHEIIFNGKSLRNTAIKAKAALEEKP